MSSKQEIIEERKVNLPLPEDPPAASDLKSLDAGKVNTDADASRKANLNEDEMDPHSGPVGREAKDNLGGLPNDAVSQGKKNTEGLADTTEKDFGYPEKSDPSSGVKN